MKHTLLSYTMGLLLSSVLIFLNYFAGIQKLSITDEDKCNSCDSAAKEIFNNIQAFQKQSYNPNNYKLIITNINDYKSSGNISDGIPLKLNEALDNAYCTVLATAIENLVKTQQNTNGLNDMVAELQNLKNITATQPVKTSTIKLANSFKTALSILVNLNSFLQKEYEAKRDDDLRRQLKEINTNQILKENSYLSENAATGLANLEHFKNVDLKYKETERTKDFLETDATKLATDNGQGPSFAAYIKKFNSLISQNNGK